MKRWRYFLISIVALSLIAGLAGIVSSKQQKAQAGAISILTNHNDIARTGQNLNETTLTTANVNATNFGKLYSYNVDGSVYAQPLYIPNMSIAGGTHNVVFIATMHNSVYAFDADTGGNALWQINLGPSVGLPSGSLGTACGTYRDISTEIGIISTPVIDAGTGTIYVVAFTIEGGNYIHRLHALDIATGQHKASVNGGQPVVISGSVSGTGSGNNGGTISFNSSLENQRSSLLELNGNIYMAFAGYCDTGNYHGWVMGYNASNLAQFAITNVTPNGWAGGIWMAGQGLVSDGSYIYAMTGNGDSDPNGAVNLGETFVKYNPSNLSLVDWFMPNNYSSLNGADLDLGSSGPVLIPGTSLLVGGGKQGIIYVMNTNSMGHFHSGSDSQIVQSWTATQGHIHGSPIYYNGSNGAHIYVWGEYSHLNSFAFNGSTFGTSPSSQTSYAAPNGMPGAMMSISANGTAAGSGIVWASLPFNADANNAVVEGELHAYDASDVSKELWNTKMNDGRDHYGNFAKFCPPTVVNGKVYMATFSNVVNVYGLLNTGPTPTSAPTTPPGNGDVYAISAGNTSPAAPYTADGFFTGGTVAIPVTGATNTSKVTNPAPQAVYQHERYGAMTYTFPNLTAGKTYTVRLHNIEAYWTAAGQRLFNVSINGTAVLTNFDIFAAAGGAYIANVQQFNATANGSGQIVIVFTAGTIDLPKINGIEIIGTTSPTNTPKPSPSNTPKPAATNTPKPGSTNTPVPANTPTPTSSGTGSCTAPAWNSATAYNGGAVVSYNGHQYTAAFWTQGNNPATSSGPAGSGQPWVDNGACSGGGSTPTAKPAATNTPKPGATNTPVPAATNTPKPAATNTPSGVAAWDPNSHAYKIGDLVTYNGHTYKCIQAHTSQAGWDPASVPSLWSLVS